MKNTFIILFALSATYTILSAQQINPPKREFRAAWVATVSNIDWPSSKSLTTSAQRSEAIAILDKHKQSNINAILFQIRPSCDAFYLNGKEPLSEWLVGSQGGSFNGTAYDPLQFWIDEAHKRGIELHCWFNPYRSVVSSGSTVTNSHISVTQPSWNISYGGSPWKLLNPGIPAVQNYVVGVIMDVVRRYNIDGVHFDDYFYPYGGMTNQDTATYSAYKGSFNNIGDWRRNNVNKFIAMVHDSIKSVKPWVKFGVSPFGIWKSGTPSGISGLSAYSAIYCDAVNWLQNQKVDYVTPQMYWKIGGPQDYSVLMPWWNGQLNGRHLYSGNAVYRLTDTVFTKANNASEIQNQIELNRIQGRALGFVAFSSKSVTNNLKGVQDSLRANQFRYPALHPQMSWLDNLAPLAPTNLTASYNAGGITLQWQKPGTAPDNDTAKYFVIYRALFPDSINMNNPKYIRAITVNDTQRFVDANVITGQKYSYIVSTFDKLNNESQTFASISLTTTGVSDYIAMPNEFALEQNFPNPFNPVTTLSFTLQRSDHPTLKVYDMLGREIATIVDAHIEAGTHSYKFSGANLASGVYIYRIISGNFVQAKKMVLQK